MNVFVCVCGEVFSSPHFLTRTKSPTELALDGKITSLGLGKSECALQTSLVMQQNVHYLTYVRMLLSVVVCVVHPDATFGLTQLFKAFGGHTPSGVITFSHADGHQLLCCCQDNTLRMVDLRQQCVLSTLRYQCTVDTVARSTTSSGALQFQWLSALVLFKLSPYVCMYVCSQILYSHL